MKSETRRDGTVQLADWWEDLLWPRVLTAAALGVRPGRIGLAFFGMVVGMAIIALGSLLDRWTGNTHLPMPSEISAGPERPLSELWRLMVAYPIECLTSMPFTSVLCVFVVLPIELVFVGAISRLVAVEFSRGEFGSWTEALAFSLARAKSLVGAVIGPVAVVWFIALVLAFAGWLLLNWPYVNVLGAGLYIVALLLGIGASLIGIVFIAGHGLLVPAVVCDGADAIDAIQRAYAYTLDRPIRLIAYMTLAGLGLGFVLFVIALILGAGVGFACAGTGFWLGETARRALLDGTLSAIPGWQSEFEPQGTYRSAAWMIRLWTMLPVYGLLACGVSCIVACKTVVYLGIRRICDGQDTAELWMPGMIEGVMSEALQGRATAAGVSVSGEALVEGADEP